MSLKLSKNNAKIGGAFVFDHPAKAVRLANQLAPNQGSSSNDNAICQRYDYNSKHGDEAWRIEYTVLFFTSKFTVIHIREKTGYDESERFFSKKDHDEFFDAVCAGE